MAGLSRYAAQALFDSTLNPSLRDKPTFLALHIAPVNDETYGSEVDFSGYARVAIDSLYAIVTPSTDGEVILTAKNGAAVRFAASAGPVMTVTHWAIWDSITRGSGNVLYSGPLFSSRLVEAGDIFVVNPDQLAISII